MRKPDGVTVEETLRAPRSSTSSSLSGQHDAPMPLSAASSASKRTLSHTTGPRRKSVLPRTAIALSRLNDQDEDDDLDLGHELPEIDDDLAGRRRAASPEVAENDNVVDTSPPTSATVASMSPDSGATTASTISSSSSEYSPYVPPSRSTQNPKRASPRKPQTKRVDGLGVGRPTSTTAGAMGRVPSSSRTALADRQANGQRSASSSDSLAASVGKAGTTVRRPVGAARRASMAV